MNRPNTLDDVALAWNADCDTYRSAIAGFLDTFYMNPAFRQGMIDPEPRFCSDAKIDAYLGAVGEHLARRWNLKIPKWTSDPKRFLHKPLFAGNIESLKALLLAQSPLAFRKRMIFVEHEPLRRARMPKDNEYH
ncbi:hypothetical protein MHY1_03217 [Methylovirgula sp. HY1]|nr:hypothetical protein MHY1_03217 [Methylovirgula sp. HY1]